MFFFTYSYKQDPPKYYDLYLTLEEINNGCNKKMKVSRISARQYGQIEEKILNIRVKPGWKAGTKIIFQNAGDRIPGIIPADLIFIVRDKPHQIFQREGSNIKYIAKISLKEALCGSEIIIPCLSSKEVICLNEISDIIKPTTVKKIVGKGLPLPGQPSKRGDLILTFQIKFPDKILDKEINILHNALPD